MQKNLWIPAALVAGLGFLSAATAHPIAYDLDASHSNVGFTVDHMGFSVTEGEFHDWQGTLLFDPEAPELSSIDVSIKTASVDTDHDERDKHLRGKDFFDVDAFPTMRFKSTSMAATADGLYQLNGDLTLHGVTRPVSFVLTINKTGEHPRSHAQHAGFVATTSIKRSDFGITKGLPAVGDEVSIRIDIEASQAAEAVTNGG